MKTSNTTEQKYLDFLLYLYNRERGFNSMSKLLRKNKLSSAVGTILRNLKLVEKKNGITHWKGVKPTLEMAGNVLNQANNYTYNHHIGRIHKRKYPKKNVEMNLPVISTNYTAKSVRVPYRKEKTTLQTAVKVFKEEWKNEKNIPHYGYKRNTGVINVHALKIEREKLLTRLSKIDTLLKLVNEFEK